MALASAHSEAEELMLPLLEAAIQIVCVQIEENTFSANSEVEAKWWLLVN